MASRWFVRVGDRIFGPLEPHSLKDLAASRKIHPQSEVGLGPEGPWHAAGTVRGLFLNQAAAAPSELGEAAVRAGNDVAAADLAHAVADEKALSPTTESAATNQSASAVSPELVELREITWMLERSLESLREGVQVLSEGNKAILKVQNQVLDSVDRLNGKIAIIMIVVFIIPFVVAIITGQVR